MTKQSRTSQDAISGADGPGKGHSRPQSGAAPSREDRLKAALKANIARRKAQARARADDLPGPAEAPGANAAPQIGQASQDGDDCARQKLPPEP